MNETKNVKVGELTQSDLGKIVEVKYVPKGSDDVTLIGTLQGVWEVNNFHVGVGAVEERELVISGITTRPLSVNHLLVLHEGAPEGMN